MSAFLGATLALERILLDLPSNPPEKALRLTQTRVRDLVASLIDTPPSEKRSLADLIDSINPNVDRGARRTVALFLLRLLSIPLLLSDPVLRRPMTSLILAELPLLKKRFSIDNKLQSHQVLDILLHVPDYCHEKLKQLAELPAQVETIKASRTVALRDLADDTLCCVLENYDFNHTRKRIEVFFKQVLDLSETSDLSFSTKAEDLLEIVEHELT